MKISENNIQFHLNIYFFNFNKKILPEKLNPYSCFKNIFIYKLLITSDVNKIKKKKN